MGVVDNHAHGVGEVFVAELDERLPDGIVPPGRPGQLAFPAELLGGVFAELHAAYVAVAGPACGGGLVVVDARQLSRDEAVVVEERVGLVLDGLRDHLFQVAAPTGVVQAAHVSIGVPKVDGGFSVGVSHQPVPRLGAFVEHGLPVDVRELHVERDEQPLIVALPHEGFDEPPVPALLPFAGRAGEAQEDVVGVEALGDLDDLRAVAVDVVLEVSRVHDGDRSWQRHWKTSKDGAVRW